MDHKVEESVWDYPRPPRLEPVVYPLQVVFADTVIAATQRGYRVLETSHPPSYYFPPSDVNTAYLQPNKQRSLCEFKGQASYLDLEVAGRVSRSAAWTYRDPTADFSVIADYITFYASRVDACYVDGEQVLAQEGDFYGGWITSWIKGPFKGGPGTRGW